jgi:hypothetical protein
MGNKCAIAQKGRAQHICYSSINQEILFSKKGIGIMKLKSAYSASRRSTLKGALVGVTGLAAAGGVVGAGVMLTKHQTLGAHSDSPATN